MEVLGQFAVASFAIIGLVNGIQFLVRKQWESFIFFMVAVLSGVVFGYLKWFGIPSIEMGFLLGLDSSGIYKIVHK